MYWDEIGYLNASTLSMKITRIIHQFAPVTPTQIAKIGRISRSNVSTKLIHLRKRGIVECITPDRRKGRLYVLTEKGLEIVNHIIKKESKISKQSR